MLNSTICQNIALCLYGNAYVNEQIDISNYLCNSSNNYCKHITFGYFDNNNPKEKFTVLSKNPIEWFNEHKQKKSVFSLHYRKISQEDIKWAGFANAGGEWITKTENEAESTYWKSFWSVQDRDDPEKKIWNVQYYKCENLDLTPHTEIALNKLVKALKEILKFAKHYYPQFSDCFLNALSIIKSKKTKNDKKYDDLVPSCYKAKLNYIFDACSSAWVFGGMGSWNDIGFNDQKLQAEYDRVTHNLFYALIDCIVATTNSII